METIARDRQWPETTLAGAFVDQLPGQMVDAIAFGHLLVSHRRMVRLDRKQDRLRGLRDLDTGEIFLTDERRLLDARR